MKYLNETIEKLKNELDQTRDQYHKSLESANRKLHAEIKKSRQYQREIINASTTARWEIGSYLHDNIAQLLVVTKILLADMLRKLPEEMADQKQDIEYHLSAIDEGIASIRDLTHDIIPVDIEEEGVEHAFRFLIRQTQKIHNVTCRIKSIEILDKIRNRQLADNLYNVVQEAARNAAVHGKAKNITISVDDADGHLALQIKDDGSGLANLSKNKLGKGLRIMKHRIELLNGTFHFGNRTDGKSGVEVMVSVPFGEN